MANPQEFDEYGRDPVLWTVSASRWVLENPDYYRLRQDREPRGGGGDHRGTRECRSRRFRTGRCGRS
jgi:hypothetical protein